MEMFKNPRYCGQAPHTRGSTAKDSWVWPGLLGMTVVLTYHLSLRIGPCWLVHLTVDIGPGHQGSMHPWVKVTLLLAPEACPS